MAYFNLLMISHINIPLFVSRTNNLLQQIYSAVMPSTGKE